MYWVIPPSDALARDRKTLFFDHGGVPIPTFPPRFLAFYDGNYDATTTTTTDVLLPERDHQTELSTLMLITIVGTNNH
jgi:hypothetical protein